MNKIKEKTNEMKKMKMKSPRTLKRSVFMIKTHTQTQIHRYGPYEFTKSLWCVLAFGWLFFRFFERINWKRPTRKWNTRNKNKHKHTSREIKLDACVFPRSCVQYMLRSLSNCVRIRVCCFSFFYVIFFSRLHLLAFFFHRWWIYW